MAAARKSADTAPAADDMSAGDAPVAGPEAATPVAGSTPPVAGEAAAAPAEEAPVTAPAGPVRVVFHGQVRSVAAGVGVCEPGGTYPVPEPVADRLCMTSLFTRAAD